jgi:thioredoxin 1
MLEELSKQFEDEIRLVRVNVDFETADVERYEVYSVPTVVFIRNGNEIGRITGAKDKDRYREEMLRVIGK